MGLYPINCPECGTAHNWFSGNQDQRCANCIKMNQCGHKSVRFGSGGYYVFCNNCSRTWTATQGHLLDTYAGADMVGNDDVREEPKK
jgi:ribosomal protein S27E